MANTKWQLDPVHSEVGFKVKHMMVSTVSGEFQKFDLDLETEGNDITTAKATFKAAIDSVTTKVEQRDNHLKSADFFDAENYPELTFESKKLTKVDDDEYEMTGDLTIRGVTNPITLKVENNGVVKDPYGNQRTGFEITGSLKRMDYGLKYNDMMEAGGAVVSNKVRLFVNVEVFHEG